MTAQITLSVRAMEKWRAKARKYEVLIGRLWHALDQGYASQQRLNGLRADICEALGVRQIRTQGVQRMKRETNKEFCRRFRKLIDELLSEAAMDNPSGRTEKENEVIQSLLGAFDEIEKRLIRVR